MDNDRCMFFFLEETLLGGVGGGGKGNAFLCFYTINSILGNTDFITLQP